MRERFSINEFKDAVEAAGGLSRGVFYDCLITREDVSNPLEPESIVLCKAANLPTSQLDYTDVKYFTRSVKIPAARQFQPITLTFYNSQNYVLRNQFLEWLSRFNSPESNIRQSSLNYATIELFPKNSNHESVGLYRFKHAFPTSISGLQYSYENDAQVQTYDVEFQYLTATFSVGE